MVFLRSAFVCSCPILKKKLTKRTNYRCKRGELRGNVGVRPHALKAFDTNGLRRNFSGCGDVGNTYTRYIGVKNNHIHIPNVWYIYVCVQGINFFAKIIPTPPHLPQSL
nr:MAG TPA: hypothetical protein [Caudoviricetes sp.]